MADMKRLTITHIETLCTIARVGTFTAAAERLHTTQSAISARIREMESTLGKSLFQRSGRRVELTVFGWAFFTQAEQILHDMDTLLASVEGTDA